jgi:hypothetical protein
VGRGWEEEESPPASRCYAGTSPAVEGEVGAARRSGPAGAEEFTAQPLVVVALCRSKQRSQRSAEANNLKQCLLCVPGGLGVSAVNSWMKRRPAEARDFVRAKIRIGKNCDWKSQPL